jgi:hypothetical protein
MVGAREPVARCIRGHDLGLSVGQIEDSLGDRPTVFAEEPAMIFADLTPCPMINRWEH